MSVEPISAAEARSKIIFNNRELSPLLTLFFEKVHQACEDRETSFNWSIGGIAEADLIEVEEDYIRALGYSLSWNRACLWYEVSWDSE